MSPYDPTPTADLLVLGAGIMGLGIALRCARAGWRVTVMERGEAGRGASWAAAGMLAPVAELEFDGWDLHQLAMQSQARWPSFAAEVAHLGGVDPWHDATGALAVAVDHDDMEALLRRARWLQEHALPVTLLDPRALAEREPGLAPMIGGLWCPLDVQVDNRALLAGLRAACAGAGVVLHEHTPVARAEHTGTAWQALDGEGVVRGSGRRLLWTVGAWTRQVDGIAPLRLPVRPVRGHMFSLDLRDMPRPIRHVIRGERVYMVPKRDRIVVGATMEEQGFDDRVQAGPVLELLEAVREVCPGALELPLQDTWVGFRPTSRDNRPLLGPSRLLPDLWVATGHHRNGIQLAPATVDLVSASLLGTLTAKDAERMAGFDPDRFTPVSEASS
jgi:glycine oxidase